jgi:TolB-like protein/DNA-binding winged helix-turn-helix (wHTH) protein
MSAKQTYEFGPFRLLPDERLLLREGKPLPVPPRIFDTLLVLVENSGHLVKKEDLMKRVWPDAFVEEVNLAQNISALRRTLGEADGGSQYIETVPKAGYRFAAIAAQAAEPAPIVTVGGGAAAAPARGVEVRPSRRNWLPWATGIFAVLITAIFAGRATFFSTGHTASAADLTIHSIAVLPLANLSDDPAQEYFSDGLTDELITRLAQLGPLQVISRTSVMGYKKALRKAPEIAKELRVDALVEGTVERTEDRVRIRVQLIRAATDQHMWAQTYDRETKNVLQLESEVAREIAAQIGNVTASRAANIDSQRPPSSEALKNYLKGRYRWNQRTEAGLRAAIGHFGQAIENDPQYAPPYAGLADC